jgi:uncharacterized protein
LHALTHDDALRDRAEAILGAFAGSVGKFATGAATYVRAVDWLNGPLTSIVVVDNMSAASSVLWGAARETYRPRTVARYFVAGDVDSERIAPELRAMVTSDAPRAYVCAGRTCAAPVGDADVLRELIKTFRGD